ncbi:hypothetical protein E4U13_008251 [Claviceps humidiphila]|uniref:MYND-type domain-containing protein n=1 Tax=Claviceps humidiphila TaxID=1294629 RepID=A0A9P7Q4V0_9HYPO|nr:hypothetical protein E4U13_008251 [Claviceps humidiphila]
MKILAETSALSMLGHSSARNSCSNCKSLVEVACRMPGQSQQHDFLPKKVSSVLTSSHHEPYSTVRIDSRGYFALLSPILAILCILPYSARDYCHVGRSVGADAPPMLCDDCLGVDLRRKTSDDVSEMLTCLASQYCSSECRDAHWSEHQEDCESVLADKIALSDVIGAGVGKTEKPKTAWGSYAATDVIRLSKQTEGPAFDGQLNILLSGVFPLRHMIYSVVNLPRTSNPKRLKFTLNATSFFDFQRTFHGVALLCLSRNDDMVKNAEALIHMWYSSRLTDDINDHVISRLADITRQRRSGQGSFLRTTDSLSECVVMEWKLPNVQLSLALQEEQKLTFDRTVNSSSDLNRLTRLEEFCFQKDDRQRDVKSFFTSAARMPRSRALGLLQWRVDGLLLPFDHPKSEFYIPNSAFFGEDVQFPQGSIEEPLSEWPMEFLDHSVEDFVAVKDVYGKMFYYLRDLLVRFQVCCRRLNLEIELCCLSPGKLVGRLDVKPEDRYDRIEDEDPDICLLLGANFLNDAWTNPCATLLTMTRESVRLDGESGKQPSLGEVWELFKPTSTALDEYTFPPAKEVARRLVGVQIHLQDRTLFGFHLLAHDDVECKCTLLNVGFLGLEYMRKNKITKRWPNRLISSRSDKPGLTKFNKYVGWVDNKPQRWLEWQLEERSDEEELEFWFNMCSTMTLQEMRTVMRHVVEKWEAEARHAARMAAVPDNEEVNLDWIDDEDSGGKKGKGKETGVPGKKGDGKGSGKGKGKEKGKKKNGKRGSR